MLDTTVTLSVEIGEPGDETPGALGGAAETGTAVRAVASIHADPNVQAIVNAFDGHIVEESIEPFSDAS